MPVTIWSQAIVGGSGGGGFIVRSQLRGLSGFSSATQVRITVANPGGGGGALLLHNWSIGIAGGTLPASPSLTKLTSVGGTVDTVTISSGGAAVTSDFVTIGTFTSSDSLIVDFDIDTSSVGGIGVATGLSNADSWYKSAPPIPPNGEYNVSGTTSGYTIISGQVYAVQSVEIPDVTAATLMGAICL